MKRSKPTKSPRIVSEQILWSRAEDETTPMHVIKLVYLCHGWMLGIFDRPLINEPVEAWRYGPVVPSVYHTYKAFRGNPITTVPIDQVDCFDEEESLIIDGVLEAYREYTPWMLSSITHQPNTPWAQVYSSGIGHGAIVPNELIKEYYHKRANAKS